MSLSSSNRFRPSLSLLRPTPFPLVPGSSRSLGTLATIANGKQAPGVDQLTHMSISPLPQLSDEGGDVASAILGHSLQSTHYRYSCLALDFVILSVPHVG